MGGRPASVDRFAELIQLLLQPYRFAVQSFDFCRCLGHSQLAIKFAGLYAQFFQGKFGSIERSIDAIELRLARILNDNRPPR